MNDSQAAHIASTLYSSVSKEKKINLLSDAFDLSSNEKNQLKLLFYKRLHVNNLLMFMGQIIEKIKKSNNFHKGFRKLPLEIKVYILHLVYNKYMKNLCQCLSLEIREDFSEFELQIIKQFKPEIQYVLLRIDRDSAFELKDWIMFTRNEASEMEKHYKEYSVKRDKKDSIWINYECKLVGHQYLGMGHVLVLMAFKDDAAVRFFAFREGGSNGYDRAENFENAISMKIPDEIYKDVSMIQ